MWLTLVHPEQKLDIFADDVIAKCSLFQIQPALVNSPYTFKSHVRVDIFTQFVSALKGEAIDIKPDHIPGLSTLCDEFGFTELSERLALESQALTEGDLLVLRRRRWSRVVTKSAATNSGCAPRIFPRRFYQQSSP
jgi:hypothetical protein